MSKIKVDKAGITNIATSIRNKLGSTTLYKIEEMPSAIDSIEIGVFPEGTLDIDENGTYSVTETDKVKVNVPLPKGSITVTENGKVDAYDYAEVNVNVPLPQGNLDISENGTYDVYDYATVKVDMLVPAGTESITENGSYDITEKEEVLVNVPTTYEVDSIAQRGLIDPLKGDICVVRENGYIYVYKYTTNWNLIIESPSETSLITENGIYDTKRDEEVEVKVPASYRVSTIAEMNSLDVNDKDVCVVSKAMNKVASGENIRYVTFPDEVSVDLSGVTDSLRYENSTTREMLEVNIVDDYIEITIGIKDGSGIDYKTTYYDKVGSKYVRIEDGDSTIDQYLERDLVFVDNLTLDGNYVDKLASFLLSTLTGNKSAYEYHALSGKWLEIVSNNEIEL